MPSINSRVVERILATPRLFLEPLKQEHAGILFPILQDARLYEFIPQMPPETEDALRERYGKLAARRSPEGSDAWLNWALRLKGTNDFVGTVQTTVHADGSARLAYMIAPALWRRGFAKEACRRVMRFLFDEFQATKIFAELDTRNAASLGLLESLGFARTGETKGAAEFKGSVSDEYRYELAREGWEMAARAKTAEV